VSKLFSFSQELPSILLFEYKARSSQAESEWLVVIDYHLRHKKLKIW